MATEVAALAIVGGYIDNGNIMFTIVSSTGHIELRSHLGSVSAQRSDPDSQYSVKIDTMPKANVTINGQRHHGGDYTIGDKAKQTLILKGESNTFTISNILF